MKTIFATPRGTTDITDDVHLWQQLESQARRILHVYGSLDNRGGGSNVPVWTPDGAVLFCRRTPGAKVPWEFQADRPDTDHFNRDYKPELARGGVEVCRLDPKTGVVQRLTSREPPVWDFRASASPDGRRIVFCRAKTGGVPGIWVADAKGRNPRHLTDGVDGKGADHPRWLPQGK